VVTLPSRSISTCVNPGGISSTWCDTRIVAGAASSIASPDSVVTSSSRPARSRPAAGSSRISSSGSVISARAICTRLRSPSLSVPNVRSASRPTPIRRSSSSVRAWSSGSYSSRHRPRTLYDAETTTSRTRSERGIRSASAALVNPIRGRRSKTSTAPSTSPRTPATPALGWIWADATCISVVLPAPLGPRMTHRSSSSTVQSISSIRVASPRRTVTPANCRTGSIFPSNVGGPGREGREGTINLRQGTDRLAQARAYPPGRGRRRQEAGR
jgi:hypothetical protein